MSIPRFDASRLSKKSAAQGYSSSGSDNGDDDEYAIPGQDIDDGFGEFNPRKRRRIGGSNNAKERAALGVFASDSDDDGPRRRWKAKTLRGKQMNFVSTGQTTLDEAEPEPEAMDEDEDSGSEPHNPEYDDPVNEDEDEDEDEDEEEEATGVGLGFGTRPAGLGFSLGPKAKDSDDEMRDDAPRISFAPTKFDGTNALGRGFVPSSSMQPVLKNPVDNTPTMPKMSRPSAFGKNSASGKVNTKSFGARMMAKMGYVEGKGLGKEGQGRNVIIEANLRPQGVGLGAVKEKTEQERREEKRQAKLRGEAVEEDSDEERRRRRERKKRVVAATGSGTASGASTPRRHKTLYMTAEELKRSSGPQTPTSYSILDLTGPGKKVLTSTAGILTPQGRDAMHSPAYFDYTVVDAEEEDRRNLETRLAWAEKELERRGQLEADLQARLDKLTLFASIADELPSLTEWDAVVACLKRLRDSAAAGYAAAADIAVASVDPFLRDADWDPLADPTRFCADLVALKTLLWPSRDRADHATVYETMMYSRWFRRVNNGIRTWDPHDPTALLGAIEAWRDLLPDFVLAELVDVVVRKLAAAVDGWNPRKSRKHGSHGSSSLPHLWLFPWLPYLPDDQLDPRGHGLVASVRRKLRQLVDAWAFERGVVPGMPQWRELLGRKEWRNLVMGHVVPSMARDLRNNFRVEPSDQAPLLPVLTGSLSWAEEGVLERSVVARVLVEEVFPRWHEKLAEWLGLEDEANMEEVGAWFEWWQEVLAPVDGEEIRREFEKGMKTIEAALG